MKTPPLVSAALEVLTVVIAIIVAVPFLTKLAIWWWDLVLGA